MSLGHWDPDHVLHKTSDDDSVSTLRETSCRMIAQTCTWHCIASSFWQQSWAVVASIQFVPFMFLNMLYVDSFLTPVWKLTKLHLYKYTVSVFISLYIYINIVDLSSGCISSHLFFIWQAPHSRLQQIDCGMSFPHRLCNSIFMYKSTGRLHLIPHC